MGVLSMPGVSSVEVGVCQYGLATSINGEVLPAQKATLLMTKSEAIANTIGRTCANDHAHGQLINHRAGPAEKSHEVFRGSGGQVHGSAGETYVP